MTGPEFAYALASGIIPSLVWLFFWTREDEHQPEPRSLLAACFICGMLAVLIAIPLEKYVAGLVSSQVYQYSMWAVIEEVLKFVVVVAVALQTKWNDEPIDAMVYIISVALGFAALENTLFILGALSNGNLLSGIVTGSLRFFGATLVHVVSSAAIGFGLGLTFYRGYVSKAVALFIGLAAAVGIHLAFNLAIVGSGPNDTLKTFAWIWAAVVILIVLFEEVKAVRPGDAPIIHTSRLA